MTGRTPPPDESGRPDAAGPGHQDRGRKGPGETLAPPESGSVAGRYWDEEELARRWPYPGEDDHVPATRLDAWRRHTATGAVLTGVALGLREVFAPRREEAVIVVEVGGDPPGPSGPVSVALDPDSATARVTVRPADPDAP